MMRPPHGNSRRCGDLDLRGHARRRRPHALHPRTRCFNSGLIVGSEVFDGVEFLVDFREGGAAGLRPARAGRRGPHAPAAVPTGSGYWTSMTESTPPATASPTPHWPRPGTNSSRSPPHAPQTSEKPTPNAVYSIFLTSHGPAGAPRCSGTAAPSAHTAPEPSTCPGQPGTTARPSAAAAPSPWPQTNPPRPDCWPRSESPPRNSPSSNWEIGARTIMNYFLRLSNLLCLRRRKGG